MTDDDKIEEPVWKRPGWITAMVGLVSAFLTVPQVVSDYLVKHQEVGEKKQEQEFHVVQNTLAQQGTERIFMLRYFAATLDDADARAWAASEVEKLEKLVTLTQEVNSERQQIVDKIADLPDATPAQKQDINEEVSAFAKKDLEVEVLRQKAGIPERQYWVVAGSFTNRDDAQSFVERIKQQTDEFTPFVGLKNAQGIWPVIIGSGTYAESQQIVDKAKRLDSIASTPYLTPK